MFRLVFECGSVRTNKSRCRLARHDEVIILFFENLATYPMTPAVFFRSCMLIFISFGWVVFESIEDTHTDTQTIKLGEPLP